jgi:hypothetical protein
MSDRDATTDAEPTTGPSASARSAPDDIQDLQDDIPPVSTGADPEDADAAPRRVRAPAPERRSAPKVTYRRPGGQRSPAQRDTRKLSLILGLGVFVVVVAVAAYFAFSGGGSPAAGPVRTSGAAASPVSYPFDVAAPAQIGTWSKLDDQSPVEQLSQEVAQTGVQKPFAVIYSDPASDSAIAWGGVGTPYGKGTAQSRLDAFFTTAARNIGGGNAGPRTDVDPGDLGGTAQCATVTGIGISMVVCGWTGTDALMGFEFSAGTLEQDLLQMPSLLAAIVIPAGNH